MRKSNIAFALARITSDALAIYAALVIAYFFRMTWFPQLGIDGGALPLIIWDWYYIFAIKMTITMVAIFAINGRYNFGADERVWDEIRHIFWAFTAGLSLLIVLFFFHKFTFFSRLLLGVAWVSGIVLILTGRQILRWGRRQLWAEGRGQHHIIVLGSGTLATQSLEILSKNPRYKIQGVLVEQELTHKKIHKTKILGKFEDLEKFIKKLRPTDILLAADHSSEVNTGQLARIAHVNHVRFQFIPDENSLDLAAVESAQLGNFPMLKLHATQLTGWGALIKSGVERVTAGCALIILSPLLIPVIAKIKLSHKQAPIFYGSKRVGLEGQEFICWKLRTMIPDADKMKDELQKKNERKGGVLFKIKDDPRITPFGKFLRQTSIDELPQLWNVIRGDMSLIGPRPHLPEEVAKYDAEHHLVLSIRPGVTGYAQIHGRSSLSFQDEMRYELFYLKNWSPWLDVIIFFKTIFIVFKRDNAE